MKTVRGMVVALATSAFASGAAAQVSYKDMADALHAVMESDRTVYTRMVVNRLQNEEKVIKASEHFKDDKALPLPAQMFRFGAEMVAEKKMGFSYSLQSLWPVNKQNLPKTALEKKGLEAVAKDPAKPFYGEETLGKTKYFTAIYADKAIAPACVTCHNEHKDSPKTDFKIGQAMGGVVLRIPMKK
jgi:cytochrome c553